MASQAPPPHPAERETIELVERNGVLAAEFVGPDEPPALTTDEVRALMEEIRR